ncbi:MAG: hypothetical protein JSS43_34230 [Proteobacteria bacterium]|nr:hypothetical protein [Pseudomonadota bacterium]
MSGSSTPDHRTDNAQPVAGTTLGDASKHVAQQRVDESHPGVAWARARTTLGAWTTLLAGRIGGSGGTLGSVSTRRHGALDYGLGIVLMALPYLGGFANRGFAEWLPVLIGLGLITYSLFTDYERGMMRVIPLSLHLQADLAAGLLLVVTGILAVPGFGSALMLIVLGAVLAGLSQVTAAGADDAVGLPIPPIFTRTKRSVTAMPQAHGPQTDAGRPAVSVAPSAPGTVEQERGAINSGYTGDKTAMTDPAASPLGSDDEAAQPHDEDGLRKAREAATREPG